MAFTLGNLNKQVCLTTSPEDELSGLHALLFQLVVYTTQPKQANDLQRLLQDIVDYLPCRILLLETKQELRDVSLEFNSFAMRKGPYLTGHEEICFRFHPEKSAQMPLRVLPYFLPDLPIYLLWGQDPTEDKEILPALLPLAKRFIFDPRACGNVGQFADRLRKLVQKEQLEVVDLNWIRIKGWKSALAEVFETPAQIQQLSYAQKIRIAYSSEHKALQAIYLQAWLAAQLHWTSKHLEQDQGTIRLVYGNASGAETIVELLAEQTEKDVAASLLSIEIFAPEGHYYSFKRLYHQQMAAVQVSSADECELPFTIALWGLERRYQFLREIFYCDHTNHYLNALHILSKQKWK